MFVKPYVPLMIQWFSVALAEEPNRKENQSVAICGACPVVEQTSGWGAFSHLIIVAFMLVILFWSILIALFNRRVACNELFIHTRSIRSCLNISYEMHASHL